MNRSSTFIRVRIGRKTILAYVDTGATICIIKPELLDKENWTDLKNPVQVKIANNKTIEIKNKAYNIGMLIENYQFMIPSIYGFDTGLPLIIGNNFLKLYQPFIQTVETVTLKCPKLKGQKSKLVRTKIYNTSFILMGGGVIKQFCFTIQEELVLRLEEQVWNQIDEMSSDNPLDPVKNTNSELVEIKLKDPKQEVNVVNRIPYTEQDVLEFVEETSMMLEKGIIEIANSPHSAPAFYVNNHAEQKRGKRRMVINYKAMNNATVGEAYKLPRQDYLFERIKDADWFSSLDAKSGYWQLRLAENTKPLTAFSCPPQKHFQFKVMPFGLKQAPSIYQRFMDKTLKGLESNCLAYIDDVIIFTRGNKIEHLKVVSGILKQIKLAGLILSKKKCQIGKEEVQFLGMKILKKGKIKPQEHLLEKLQDFSDQLEDRKQIQKFLGCLNYLCDKGFIKNIVEKKKILQDLLSTKKLWKWETEHTEAVKFCKNAVKTLPELYLQKEKDLLILTTDASHGCWSAVLQALPARYDSVIKDALMSQKDALMSQSVHSQVKLEEMGKTVFSTKQVQQFLKEHAKELQIVKWANGTFSPTQTNYTTHEKETLALIKSLRKFKIDLLPKTFIYQTDSTYTKDFLKYKNPFHYNQGRLLRWALEAQQYSFIPLHIAGTDNIFADLLTREWSISGSGE
ncbi:putative aspartic protease [Water chestnut soymovirus 1]|uniref:RNA-directed DNA polymerase n=1 Tax=Water chestnut soymovirus 1 TaxID=1848040 RepID=A0A172PC86_9VIRU|nr:putative aspartic protease [Water chestnut soymovirus 1]AND65752.1 putative aspartic protease [Water chestnut soymovirus 1]